MSLTQELEHAMRQAADEGLALAAQAILEEAKRNVPIGDPAVDPDPNVSLADSGHLDYEGAGVRIVFDAPYAAKVHEDLRLQHPRGGTAKFLERAVTTFAPHLERFVASRVAANTATGLSTDRSRSHSRRRV